MKKLAVKLFLLASVMILATACNISKESDKNIETIRTIIKNEFTGPNEELTAAFKQDGVFPPELKEYVEKNYEPLLMDWEDMVNKNLILFYQRVSFENGYLMKPTNIEIIKDSDLAYDCKVDVEYSKNGESSMAIVAARINLNEDGKIVSIRNMDVGGLLEKMNQ
ncbi:hypothetical protein [Rossellomorea sp. DA94]|uniref:hypothetical protein n=1 Tax=Rossellomorea sp. DA94 TaxID=3038653 RepID=UPI002449DFDB|nr:hypothetical protein [Rossellomorea sp. DA94]WGG44517.1 hypothetical protein P8596_17335 [Rossellomorea sp. DA94]